MMYRLSAEMRSTIRGELTAASVRAATEQGNNPDPRPGQIARLEIATELVQAVYDYVKEMIPGGGGFDGADGPERAFLGQVLDTMKFKADDLAAELHGLK